jgi:flagellar biosynthesis protein FlhF
VKVHTFIADSAPEAVAQIRAQLGPEAVVLNVRKVEATGLQKIWKKAQIEVLAHLPEPEMPRADPLAALTELRREIADLRREIPREAISFAPPVTPLVVAEEPLPTPAPTSRINYGSWKIGGFLEQTGVLPRHVETIVSRIESEHGEVAPENLLKEMDLARGVLEGILGQSLLTSAATNSSNCHIFIGVPGAGKTTALSKMLAQLVLMEGLPARVLRLDGARANTAESLSVYCEILGVPVERCLTEDFQAGVEMTFVDLPGVSVSDADGLKALAALIAQFPEAQVHLVLNAAYETTTLLNQVRAFGALPISSLVFTHLDEEQRWGKLINFCLGTKFSIGHLSAGQNVPGDLFRANVEKILSRVIPSK